MSISLLHPSRGRPQKAKETFIRWQNARGNGVRVEYILSLDSNDPTLPEYKKQFEMYDWVPMIHDNSSVVEATNHAARHCNEDIMVYLSDDFDCPDEWDVKIMEEFLAFKGPALLKVDDCLQPFHVPVLTIPILNRAFYERTGYFWNPLYKSMFVDEDLHWTARKLEALRYAPHLKFPHNHVSVGKAKDDETYRRSAANWDQGKEVFRRRKAAGFPL